MLESYCAESERENSVLSEIRLNQRKGLFLKGDRYKNRKGRLR